MSEDIEQDSVPVENDAPVADTQPESSPAPQAEAPVASTPWDSFKQLPQFQGQDDRAIATSLYQAMQREQAATRALQQYQSIMPIAQEYLSYRPEFQKWRESQQQQPQAPQQAAPAPQAAPQQKWWNPPEVKESYKRYLTKDEHGRDVIHPDAPYDAKLALTEWQNYRADFAQKFLSNPEEALGPMVAELAQKQAQEIVQEQLATRDREAYVETFEKENADWLYDQQTGSVSPAGLLLHKYIDEARARGIPPGKERADYAVEKVELELFRQRYAQDSAQPQQQYQPQPTQVAPPVQQAPPQPAVQAAPQPQDLASQNMNYLRREASRNPSRSAGAANNDPRQPKQKLTFEQMLAENLNAAGYT
jgi:hypothetical protein